MSKITEIFEKQKEKAFLKFIGPNITDLLTPVKEWLIREKNKFQLLSNEKEVVALIYESRGVIYISVATVNENKQIERQVKVMKLDDIVNEIIKVNKKHE